MKLWPFFCFYGGKWRMAPHYPMPRRGLIIEPFAGAAGYALRYPNRTVQLYDAAGRRYRYSEIDFLALGRWCQTLPGQVIVCEQTGADWLPFVPFMRTKSTEGKNRENQSSEVLWTSEMAA